MGGRQGGGSHVCLSFSESLWSCCLLSLSHATSKLPSLFKQASRTTAVTIRQVQKVVQLQSRSDKCKKSCGSFPQVSKKGRKLLRLLPTSPSLKCKAVVGTTCGNSTTPVNVVCGFVNEVLPEETISSQAFSHQFSSHAKARRIGRDKNKRSLKQRSSTN